jgi:hypothetical protein
MFGDLKGSDDGRSLVRRAVVDHNNFIPCPVERLAGEAVQRLPQ